MLTKKGRMFPNVFHNRGRFDLVTKRKGLRLGIKTIMASPEHGIAGHERLRCDACHTRAVPQCYGCHTAYDERLEAYDFIRGEEISDGAFRETEDMRLASPFPLVVDQENRIVPATPGCQTLLTYILTKTGSCCLKTVCRCLRASDSLNLSHSIRTIQEKRP